MPSSHTTPYGSCSTVTCCRPKQGDARCFDCPLTVPDYATPEEHAKRTACEHNNLPVKYDPEAAKEMTDAQVRKNFPRYDGPCPDCGERVLGYASFEHYVSGDW